MKKLILSVLLLAGWGLSQSAAEMMTYQGRLKDGAMPANGNYSFSFALCSDGTGTGAGCSPDTAAQSFEAANGLFKSTFTIPAVDLSAGPWYLRVTVNSSVLVPLERLTFVPYSVFSSSAGYAYSASTLTALSGPAVFASTHVVVRGELTAGDWELAPSTYAVVEGAALLKDLNPGAQDVRVGVSGHAISATAENIDILAGGNFEAEIPTGKSGIMIGVRAGIDNSGSSAQAVGVLIDGINNNGSIADTYGIFISTLHAGTQANKPYAIYSEDLAARTYIAGNVGVSSVPAYALVVSSASGDVMWVSSYAVHGQKFIGDGSGLTGVTGATGTDSTKVLKTGDTMTGQLTNTSSITITGNGGAYGLAVSSNVSLSGVIYTANGNLGIGLSTASERLTLPYNGYLGWDANDTGDGVVVHKIGKSATGAAPLEFINNGNPGPAGKQFLFSAQGTEIFTLLDNGSVGISSTVPANKLAVSGGILAASSITAQGFMNAAYYQVNGSTVLSVLPGIGSLAVGPLAGEVNSNAYNVFVGSASGKVNSAGLQNTMVGYASGLVNLGTGNTFLGAFAGSQSVNGGNNIVIGALQDTSATNSSYELNVGGLLFGRLNDRTVGISTRAPQAALDVVSTGTASNVYAQIWRAGDGVIKASVTAAGVFYGDGSGLTGVTGATGTDPNALHTSGGTMTGQLTLLGSTLTVTGDAFSVGGSTLVVASGRVGIGTLAPGAELHVKNTYGRAFLESAAGNTAWLGLGHDSNAYWTITNNATGGDWLSFNNLSNASQLVLLQGGNLGVGANVPMARLHVRETSAAAQYALIVSTNSDAASYRLAVSTSGSLGVRVFPPAAALDVAAEGSGASDYAQVWRNSAGVITASATATGTFYGDGSGLRNVSAPANVLKAGDTMTGRLSVVSDTVVSSTDIVTNGIVISTSGAIRTTGAGNGPAAGNARGIGAVDLQTYRTSASSVAAGAYSVVAGGQDNRAGSGWDTVSGGYNNTAANGYGTVSGGQGNSAAGMWGTVSGGKNNAASTQYATVSGGEANAASSLYASVAGGIKNTASAMYTIVAGGSNNSASNNYAAVAGGSQNNASGQYSAAGGGALNLASADYAAVAGGNSNTVSGNYASIPGGSLNTALGSYSWAGGYASSSTANGAFTWADSQGTVMENSVADRSVFKSRGGFIVTGSTSTNMQGGTDRGVYISGNGLVGISTGAPYAALDVVSTATASNVYAQVWRNSSGVIVASITSQGSLATAIPIPGDNLGNHSATTDLQMNARNIYNVSTITASGNITAASYQIGGSTVLAVDNTYHTLVAGIAAGYQNGGANDSVLVGYRAGAALNGANDSTFIGSNAGYSNTTGAENTFVGMYAGHSNVSGNYNSFYGTQAGDLNSTGSSNIYIGYFAGSNNTSGAYNAAVGQETLNYAGAGSANVALGYRAGYGGGGSPSSSTLVGYQAGYSLAGGAVKNILIGYEAGYQVTTGTGNIIIGNSTGTYTPGDNNVLNIGGVLFGTLSEGGIGINSFLPPLPARPMAALDVVSTGTAANVYAQVWRDSSGVVVASMTSIGALNTAGISISSSGAIQTAGIGNGSVVGNARGTGAVDLQTVRQFNTDIAAGNGSVVSGGSWNSAGGSYASVGGGLNNHADASYAVIPGGSFNTASGSYSFAAGYAARSTAQNTFTWQDSGGNFLDNSAPDRVVFKAKGGFVVTNSTAVAGMSATLNRGFTITGNGLVGISTGIPQAALDVVSTGTAANVYAQVWRDSSGVIVATVTSQGVFYGNGSGLAGISASGLTSGTDIIINSGANTRIQASGTDIATFIPGGTLKLNTANTAGAIKEALRLGNPGTGNTTGASLTFFNNGPAWEQAGIAGFYDNPTNSNTLAFYTGNGHTERMRVTGSGYVGIATDTPKDLFQVGGGTLTVLARGDVGIGTTDPKAGLDVQETDTAGMNYSLRVSTSDLTYHLVVTTGGWVGINEKTPRSTLHLVGTGKNDGVVMQQSADIKDSSYFGLMKSRGNPGAEQIVQPDDNLGLLAFAGYNGNAGDPYPMAAALLASVDGTPGLASMPTRLELLTTTAGTLTPLTRMTINAKGDVGISTGVPQARLDVMAAGNLDTDYAQIWRDSGGVVKASVTATGIFYGNGSGLTNVSGTDNTKVLRGGDTMSGPLYVYSDVLIKSSDIVTTGIVISTGGALQTTGIGYGSASPSSHGRGAVDLQTSRIGPGQAAIGDFSTIGGGISNTANGYAAVVSGGQQNWAGTYSYATVSGGVGNSAMATYATVGGGSSNKASGYFSVVAGGQSNSVYQDNSAAAGGAFNVVSASNSFSGGGLYNTVAGTSSVVAGGESNAASDYLSFVGGGKSNAVVSSYSVVGGGEGNATYAIHSVIGGGFGNTANAGYNTIAGGSGNIVNNAYGAIGGGMNNTANEYGFIGGGYNNQATMVHSAVAGGWNNIAGGMDSFVGGGENNQTGSVGSVIAGGQNNFMSGTNQYAYIGGGSGNNITGNGMYAVIGGGLANKTYQQYSGVLSGSTNTAGGQYAVVAGGWNNTAGMWGTTIGGGIFNIANVSAYATIAGGSTNTAGGYDSFIGAGEINQALGQYAVVAGGYGNIASLPADHSFIGGGISNSVSNSYATIAGGSSNTVTGMYGFVGGGGPLAAGKPGNRVLSDYSAVVGGSSNTADANGWMSFIGGGSENVTTGQQSFIGGGWMNRSGTTLNYYSAVVAGYSNVSTGDSSFVGAGGYNSASGITAAVAGGYQNKATGNYSAIPGGYGNTAKGVDSFAAGYMSSSTANGTFTWADSQGYPVENNVQDRTWFKNRGGFLVSGSTNAVDSGLFVAGDGRVSVGDAAPKARLQVLERIPTQTDPYVLQVGTGTIPDMLYVSTTGAVSVKGDLNARVWQRVFSADLASDQTSLTISGLNGEADAEYKLIMHIVNPVAGLCTVTLQLNGDSASANYTSMWMQGLNGGGTNVTHQVSTTLPGIRVGTFGAAASNESGGMAEGTLYARSGSWRTYLGNSISMSGVQSQQLAGRWNNTASPVTSLVLTADVVSCFGGGSHVELWAFR
ncbi:MAG: hypothetical protein M0025_03285 [Elusimicrobia bacterium]|nr:hypothetical protein [Elusimicrobiota bacterium]